MASFDENVANMMKAMKGKKTGGVSTAPVQSNQQAEIQRQLTQTQMGANQQQANNQALMQEATRQDNVVNYQQQQTNIGNKANLATKQVAANQNMEMQKMGQNEQQALQKLDTEKNISIDKIYNQITEARSDQEMQNAENNFAIYAQIKAFTNEDYIRTLENAANIEGLQDEQQFNMAALEKSYGSRMLQLMENFGVDMNILEDNAKMGIFLQNLSDQQLIDFATADAKGKAVGQAIEAGKDVYIENKDEINGAVSDSWSSLNKTPSATYNANQSDPYSTMD